MPSTTEGVLLLIGAIFFLIGLLGGGFEFFGAKIPAVGKWPRIFSGGTGALLLGIGLIRFLAPTAPPQPAAATPATPLPASSMNVATPVFTAIPPATNVILPTQSLSLQPTMSPVAPTTSPGTLPATTMEWQKMADLPRRINALVVDPANPRVIYAAAGDSSGSGAGVFKSDDGGITWRPTIDGLPSESVTALAIAPDNPLEVFAKIGVRGDLYASSDGGASWTKRSDTGLFGGFEHLLRINPRNPSVMFALSKSGDLVRSVDGGDTWQPNGSGLPHDEHQTFALSLAFDPSDPNILYIGTGGFVGNGHGVYKSVDGGETWAAVNRGMLDYRITAVAVHPTQPQTVYAGSDNGDFFKSVDGGQTWEALTARLPVQMSDHPSIKEIIINAGAADSIYLLVDDAGVVVGDGIAAWRLLGQPGSASFTSYTAMAAIFDSKPTLLVAIEGEGGWRYGPAQ